jgi:two-component system phosphate regulon response regulator PhoB
MDGSDCMANIVLIDDERDILDVLEFNLRQAGHDVSTAMSGSEGLLLVAQERPDLVVLDLMLPDLSGTDVCRSLKSRPELQHIPVLMLSARGDEVDRIVGFELGADDYVRKPFSVRELLLRVRAIVARGRKAGSPPSLLRFGRLAVDRDAHRAWVDGAEVELTALEFKLLILLYDRKNRVQTRETLLEAVWGLSTHVSLRTVDAHVKRLREKLLTARDYVETVRGVGYRFRDTPEEPFGD